MKRTTKEDPNPSFNPTTHPSQVSTHVRGVYGGSIIPLWELFGVYPCEAMIAGYILKDFHSIELSKQAAQIWWEGSVHKVYSVLSTKRSTLTTNIITAIIQHYNITHTKKLNKEFLAEENSWNKVLKDTGLNNVHQRVKTYASLIVCEQKQCLLTTRELQWQILMNKGVLQKLIRQATKT